MRYGLVYALATALVTLSAASPAVAAAEARTAKVIVAGDDAEVGVVHASVIEQLGRLGVVAETDRANKVRPEDVVDAAPGEPRMIARVWIDASSPSETILYVVDRSGARVFVRRFARAGRSEIARESALAALQTVIDALLQGALIGVTREEARAELHLPPPAPPCASPREPLPEAAPRQALLPPPPRRPAVSHTTFGLALSYEVGGYSNTTVEHGPLVTVALTRPFHGRIVGLALTAQYRFPLQVTNGPVLLRIESGAIRLNALMELVRVGSLEVRALLGGGVDVVRAAPGLVDQVDASLTPIRRVDAVVRAGVAGRLPLVVLPRTTLELALALDVAPAAHPYGMTRGPEETVLLSPWTVRPLVIVGVGVP